MDIRKIVLDYEDREMTRKFGETFNNDTPCKDCGERFGVHLGPHCPHEDDLPEGARDAQYEGMEDDR